MSQTTHQLTPQPQPTTDQALGNSAPKNEDSKGLQQVTGQQESADGEAGQPPATQAEPDWSTVPPRQPGQPPLVVFDGVCNLCNQSVDWLVWLDRKRRLRYTSLQGKTAGEILAKSGPLPENTQNWSMLLWDQQGIHTRSDAALRTLAHLGGLYTAAHLLRWLIPRFLRDAVYRAIARRRYRWFGQKDSCRVPTPEERALFLP